MVEYKWNGEVSEDDPCQPVKEEKIGGIMIFCKGKCPSKDSRCGILKSRPRGSEQPWKDLGDGPSKYEPKLEYSCHCYR
jgi:hypothetical protein